MRKIMTMATVLVMASILTGCMCLHKWEEATCAEPKTCTRCGATEGKTLAHDWVEADCENPKTCEECGAAEGEALGHTVTEWEVISESSMRGVCSVCREKVNQELDYKILGMQEIIGKWTMIGVQPGGLSGEWETAENRSSWVKFSENGDIEYRFDDAAGKGDYQFTVYSERFGVYWYYAEFENGYLQFRLDENDDLLYWIADEIWFCFEKKLIRHSALYK